MKESYWGYWLLVLGVFIIVVLLLVQSFTSTNTQDYYMVKTITEAAMEDSIDYAYFRTYGEAKINKEKFFESFLRRFSEEASLSTTYQITFSDVYEAPPKVSVKVASKAGGFSIVGDSGDIDIVNKIDAILESSEYSKDNVSTPVSGAATTKAAAQNRLEDNSVPIAMESQVESYQKGNFCMKFTADMEVDTSCLNSGTSVTSVQVGKCGIPNKSGIEQGLTENTLYCVVYAKNNKRCAVTKTIDKLDTYLKTCE